MLHPVLVVALGVILEEVTGEDLADLLEDRVFDPAGLRHTSYPDDPGTRGPFLVGAAWTGTEAQDGLGWMSLDGFDPDVFGASGAVVSTTKDLNTFTEALIEGDLVDGAIAFGGRIAEEMFTGDNGWAITSAEDVDDLETRDRIEADGLFDLLERQIVPLFHDRRGSRIPRHWLARVKQNLASLGPAVVASRMVRDYVTDLYEPTALSAVALRAEGHARARDLAAWKERVLASWAEVSVVDLLTLQPLDTETVLEAAKADLTPEELPRYFAVAARGKRAQAHAYISPWAGHDDHMHIRFGCSEVDVGCLSVPKARKSKNSGKSGKSAKNASKKSSRPSQG